MLYHLCRQNPTSLIVVIISKIKYFLLSLLQYQNILFIVRSKQLLQGFIQQVTKNLNWPSSALTVCFVYSTCRIATLFGLCQTYIEQLTIKLQRICSANTSVASCSWTVNTAVFHSSAPRQISSTHQKQSGYCSFFVFCMGIKVIDQKLQLCSQDIVIVYRLHFILFILFYSSICVLLCNFLKAVLV